MALALFVFWGSFGGPIISDLFFGTETTYGKEFYMTTTPPLFLALYILMGIAPLSAWGVTSIARVGKALLIPVLLTVASMGLFVLNGMTTPVALIGYGFVVLAGWIAVVETVRGVIARRKNHRESVAYSLSQLYRRNPRRYGGYMIHLGVTIIGIGVIGSTLYQQETQQTLSPGQTLSIAGYEMRFDRFDGAQIAEDGRLMDIAVVSVIRNGQELATLRPRRDTFPGYEDMGPSTIAGAYSTLENDFYVLLVAWEPVNASSVTFKVYVNPLINLIWWGGVILIIGTMLAGWPRDILPERILKESKIAAGAAASGAAS
jgi:cytochrome c-type biogenesis protein CcmF